MVKKYIKPENIVVAINLSKPFLEYSVVTPENFSNTSGGPEGVDDGEYAREENNDENNNRGSVWDNIW